MIGRSMGLLRGSSSGWCVRGSSGCDNLENGGQAGSRRQWLGPLTTDGQLCGEHLTHQPLLEALRRPKPRPIIHAHLTKHAAVARATAGKVLASRRARQGQSTRRGLSSPPIRRSSDLRSHRFCIQHVRTGLRQPRSSTRLLERETRWSRCFTSWAARIARGGCSVPGGRTLRPAPCRPLLGRRPPAP